MSRAPIGFYREVWLIVASGGWWSIPEILERLPDGVEVDAPHNRLWIMAHRHHYIEQRGSRKDVRYAVTPDCVAPQGVPVGRMMEALAGAVG